ncbi:UNVERIFIED_CONTAM: Acyl-coenzyme A oxidase 2, peroxisomal [Sesamum calycinum]|uniref:Acyl-coenzyme A oxidase n=1 Tax=Sesamum calycinum TaxID=2727403 RepID=A0AAW2SWQ0_9LAMI
MHLSTLACADQLDYTHSFHSLIKKMESHEPKTSNLTAEEDGCSNWDRAVVARRVERLFLHLNPPPEFSDGVGLAPCAGRAKIDVNTEQLSKYMRGKYRDVQQKVYDYFNSRPELQTPLEISKDEHRELCMRQLMGLVREAGIRPFRYVVEEPAKYFAILEAVGSVDMSLGIKMGVQYSLWGGSVLNLGTKKHRDKYFEGIDSVEYPGCFAMTELHHGSNVQGLQTVATFDPIKDEFIIDTPNDGAIKWWIGNAAVHGKFATVFAKLMLPTHDTKGVADMGVHAFIVPIRDMKTHKPLPGVEIHDCGHKVGLNGVDNGALRFRKVTEHLQRSLWRSWICCCHRFGGLRNDHDIFQTFEGDNTVLLQQVAGYLLKQYKEKFQGGTLTVTWNYLRESMNSYLSQPNPVTARWEGEDHLRDPKFQLDAFRYRTSRLLQSLAVRLRKHSKTLGSFGAWNRCLNHLLTLAESHIESVILAKFIDAVRSCPDPSSRAALKLLCDLYALDRIWNDIGTYRNVDYVAPNKAKAIHKLTEYLCFQVKNISRELVDAFDLPDYVTRAPIGMQAAEEAYAQYTQFAGF